MGSRIESVFLVLIFSGIVFAQTEDLQVGGSYNQLRQNQGAYYDYSDPDAVNIKVAVWGFVKYPGKYVVPVYTTITDLLSFAGGPSDDSHLTKMKIIRTNADSTQSTIEINYKDILWDTGVYEINSLPKLLAGDVLVVPGEPKLYFKDYLSISLSIFSALISLAILIININN